MRLANMRTEAFSRQVSTIEDIPNLRVGHSLYAADMLLEALTGFIT
jgi:hypothetical protein